MKKKKPESAVDEVRDAMLAGAKSGNAAAARLFLRLEGKDAPGAPWSATAARAQHDATLRWAADEGAHQREWRRLLRPAVVYCRDPQMVETEAGESILPSADELAAYYLEHSWANTDEEAREAARQQIATYEAREGEGL